jgi:hypothetical protein
MMKKFQIFVSGLMLVVLVAALAPVSANAQTVSYHPQTQAEKVAYLYGRIAQLLQIKQLLGQGKSFEEAVALSSVDYVTISTHRAIEITETTAVLRGEVNLYGKATAQAWFEYGEDEDFLDQRTNQTSVRSAYDRAVRMEVRNLEQDERYYFRLVVMSGDGIVSYGDVYQFRSDEEETEDE